MAESFEQDNDYGDDGSYEDQHVGTQAPDLSSLVEKGHVKSEQVFNTQKRTLVFDMFASPVEAARQNALCECKFQDNQHQHFQEVRSIANRHDPKPEDLSGDIDQIVITSFKLKGFISEPLHPVMVDFLGVQVPEPLRALIGPVWCLSTAPRSFRMSRTFTTPLT